MKGSYDRIFKDKSNLEKLFILRRNGVSKSILADMFACDRKTIFYQLKKNNIVPETGLQIFKKTKKPLTEVPDLDEYGSIINKGQDYETYLSLEKAQQNVYGISLEERIIEENKKSKFCTNPEEVLIRMKW